MVPDKTLERIGRYTIEARLGGGAMGDVYLAYDTRLHRRVALKVLGAAVEGMGVAAVGAALREARAAGAIMHPNATAVFDADEADGLAYIAMEYVPGTPLRRLVGDASLPLAARLRWLMDIASALAAAHAAGVVHRDVKPENVMVRDDGVVKVLDFGVARIGPGGEDEIAAAPFGFSTWSHEGGFVGTPGYMAPEVLGGREVDGRADQFAWGVLAYELCAGRLPWDRADTPIAAISSVLTQTPAPLGPEVPAEVAAAVARALAKDPAERFPSLSAAAAALAPFADPAGAGFVPPVASTRRVAAPRPSAPDLATAPLSPRVPTDTLVSLPDPPVPDPATAPTPSPSAPPPPATRLRPPDFAAPVDVEAQVALLPAEARCKGMFFTDLLKLAATMRSPAELAAMAAIPDRRYVAFRDYPVADSMRLAAAVASIVYPKLPLGEGLRRVGRRAFDVVLDSHIGRTLFGVFGADIDLLLLQGSRSYKLLVGAGEVTCEKVAPREFVLRARDMPLFLETYQVGVLEGVLGHCGRTGEVLVEMDGLASATLWLRVD
jgi:uncharacterized protein (TIGR02265 family)